jgi:Adenylate and Guanylate cyclase catalytic domain
MCTGDSAGAGRRQRDAAPTERIETRIGVHLGDVIVQDYRVYGDGVNIAARLQAIAAPGSICVSEAVYQQVYTQLALAFEDLGVQALKNIEHPIRLYRVAGSERPGSLQRPPRDGVTWTDALLHPSSIAQLVASAYLIATVFGLPPAGHLLPAWGVVLLSVGIGRVLRLRTQRPAAFLIALGPGLLLAGVVGDWRRGMPWWLVVGGIVVMVVGLTQLRTAAAARLGLVCHLAVYHGRVAPPNVHFSTSGNVALNNCLIAPIVAALTRG